MEVVTKISQSEQENFVTVVAVGPDTSKPQPSQCDQFSPTVDLNNSGYVTVLTIGDSEVPKDTVEEVLVYRLPGERLGFGLKFEGGTKAHEFVKRLFIQSCAPDSPASRVQSSWGILSEGDEVLEIDCMAVNAMTRIDCVRCLKDSNVVIKLLVRHFYDNSKNEARTRSVEDLPQVVSAEKKRTPPPPPPVPPRKIPKKCYKNKEAIIVQENPVPAIRHTVNSDVTAKTKKFQSPRSSGRSSYSPDIPRRDRRFSDGSLGPPDAEVYVDLFSQESTQSLSESDDTGSSISTVVDRFGSFPTTTTSSLAGSLPSTPTSVQKQLDFSNLLNFDDDDSPNKNTVKQSNAINKSVEINEKAENDKPFNAIINVDGIPLQPPSCFQDAPLSYGNEDMRIIETASDEINSCESIKTCGNNVIIERKVLKKPPVPPRSKDVKNGSREFRDENMNISNLPRLVDFVPKSANPENFDVEIVKVFLENERRETDFNHFPDERDVYGDEIDLYSSKWSLSSQLATIGEVEEEGQDFNVNRSPINSTPIVIVENADCEELDRFNQEPAKKNETTDKDINGNMETLPSDSRQPPDGHEFPDYLETNTEPSKKSHQNFSYTQLKATDAPNKPSMKTYKSIECVNLSQNRSSFNDFSSVPIQNKSLNKINSVSNSDLSSINSSKDPFDTDDDVQLRRNDLEPKLHTRSQSLIDMSSISKQNSDRWSLLAEQRKKGLSKLKGLVIPEHVSENEVAPAVNIPEIISQTAASFVLETKTNASQNNTQCHSSETEPVALPLTAPPPWTSNSSTLPKYSPAFKRKSLQVYPPLKKHEEPEPHPIPNQLPVKTAAIEKNNSNKSKIESDEFRLDSLSDAPKSLESITSPTRSDCSFDYVANSFKIKKQEPNRTHKESPNHISKLHKDLGKSEDESDNDSAVSSSQSSYISRCSPPPSPTRSCEMLDYDSIRAKSDDGDKYSNLQCRLLKPASVEAINRKNILASAKCRSGRDLKVGSPVIQRKYEENGDSVTEPPPPILHKQDSEAAPINPKIVARERRSVSCEEFAKSEEKIKMKDNEPNSVLINNITESISTPIKPVIESSKKLAGEVKEVNLPPLKNETRINIGRPSSLLRNTKAMSVTDLRKNFEKFDTAPPPLPQAMLVKKESTKKRDVKKLEAASPDKKLQEKHKKVEEVAKMPPVKVKPSSKEKSTEKLQQLPTDLVQRKVVLTPKFFGGSIGITLAGGADYETKEITVHKIRYGSVAYSDGKLKKGDRIISINGKSTSGLTHTESVEMLKEPVEKFELVVEDGKEEVASPQRKSFVYETPEKSPVSPTAVKNVTHVITLIKDGAGLGFSIDGGKDSSQGDLPLLVKKIFQGGAADKTGELGVGDELLAINGTSVANLSRIEVWSLMKKLPDGSVSIHIHR